MRTEHKGCLSWPQATHHVEALARWTFPWTVSGLKKLGPKWIRRHKACRDRGFAMHFPAIYTIITRRKCALRHTSARCAQYLQDRGLLCDTSMRSAQYLQHGGLLWDTPPRDLHGNYQCFWAPYLFRRCALRHTSARSAQFL